MLSLGLVFLSSTVHAQTRMRAKAHALATEEPRLVPGFEDSKGRLSRPVPQPIPQRTPLNFSLPGYDVETPSSTPEKQRADLLARVQALDAEVQKAIGPLDGETRRSADDILKALEAAATAPTVPNQVKLDLQNLLIATTVNVKLRFDTNVEGELKTWSYRRLNDVAALCGPPIVAHPNSTLLIPVLNLLDKQDLKLADCKKAMFDPVYLSGTDEVNTPHGFDVINLHTHGLNVSPSWPADDVFREIQPFQIKYFVYHLHGDHPHGTFWYHPHKHGAVGAHVAGGMAGALIVKAKDGSTGLEKLGRDKGWRTHEEQPLVFQQITAFSINSAEGGPPKFIVRPDFHALKSLIKKPDIEKVPAVEKLVECMKKHLPPNARPAVSTLLSGVPNARLLPRKTGETYRLRLIQASIEDEWWFNIQKVTKDADGNAVPVATEDVEVQVIAYDGMTLEEPYMLSGTLRLAPGNRADVLVCFKENAEGEYALCDTGGSGENGIVGRFEVTKGDKAGIKSITKAEVTAYKLFKRPPVVADLQNPATFEATFKGKNVVTENGGNVIDPGEYFINKAPFPGWPKVFRVGEPAAVWFGVKDNSLHPIHIHVNPVLRPVAAEEDPKIREGLPPGQYWTDTMAVKQKGFTGRMSLDHFSGKSVVHCHILDHEDNGMMNAFVIRPPKTPIAPLPGVFDLESIPNEVRNLLAAVWPQGGKIPPQDAGEVTLFAFLPRAQGTKACMHCAEAIQAIAKLRESQEAPPFRIVAVTGPNIEDVDALVKALKLDARRDVLCTDGKLRAFQAMALVDGVPVFDTHAKVYTAPGSFKSDGTTLRHFGDLMHGLFIVSPNGFLVSSNRGFIAHDDTEQTLAELRFALSPHQNIAKLKDMLIDEVPSTPAEKQTVQRDLPNIKRMEMRLESYQRSIIQR